MLCLSPVFCLYLVANFSSRTLRPNPVEFLGDTNNSFYAFCRIISIIARHCIHQPCKGVTVVAQGEPFATANGVTLGK